MNSTCISKCRFCYSYTPPGPIDNCCEPVVCTTNNFIESVSSLTMVVNNNTRTTERSLLISAQQAFYEELYSTSVNSTLQYVNQNMSIITSTIYDQLLGVRQDRTLPYQPYMPQCPPSSVTDLLMRTVNVGVPFPVETIANCKGNQFITTSNVIYF